MQRRVTLNHWYQSEQQTGGVEGSRARAVLKLSLAAILAVICAAPVAAQAAGDGAEAAAPTAASQQEVAAAPAGSRGLVVARDPETGELRAPTAAERERLTTHWALERSTEEMERVVLPDGAVLLKLGDRFLTFTVAARNPQGKVTQHCTTEPERTLTLLGGAQQLATESAPAQEPETEVRDAK